jgi:hypothetical protein
VPTSTSAVAGNPLFLTNSSESAKGTTSSAWLCRITVPGFTVLAVPHFFQARAEQDEPGIATVEVHGNGTAS